MGRWGVKGIARYKEKAREENKEMHNVAVTREQCCRVVAVVVQQHKVGPMMIVIV